MSVYYPDHLQPSKFSFIKQVIDEEFPKPYPDWVKYSSVIHNRITSNTEYHTSGSNIPEPSKMMSKLTGDCQDQSVLIGSLMAAADLDIRFTRVKRRGGAHVLLETRPPVQDTDVVCTLLNKFYSNELNKEIGKISWDTDSKGDKWFIADATMSNYVGDTSSLRSKGYIRDSNGRGWEWNNLKEYQEV